MYHGFCQWLHITLIAVCSVAKQFAGEVAKTGRWVAKKVAKLRFDVIVKWRQCIEITKRLYGNVK